MRDKNFHDIKITNKTKGKKMFNISETSYATYSSPAFIQTVTGIFYTISFTLGVGSNSLVN